MRPDVGWSSPAMSPSSVDLPLPDGPAMARNWPAGTSKDTSVSTSTPRPPLVRRMESERTVIMVTSILHKPARSAAPGDRTHRPRASALILHWGHARLRLAAPAGAAARLLLG